MSIVLEGDRKGGSMWLEELAWLWLPIVGALGLWIIWSNSAMKAEVRSLRERLDRLEVVVNFQGAKEGKAA